jgi:hypothetical protein
MSDDENDNCAFPRRRARHSGVWGCGFLELRWERSANGRVRMWRGGLRCGLSVPAPFVWRCLTSRTITPFPHPPHRTGQAELPHPALGQDACLRPRKVSCRPPHHRRGPCYPPRLTTSGRVAANRWCRRLGEPPLPGLKSEFSLRFSMWCLPQLPHTTGVS